MTQYGKFLAGERITATKLALGLWDKTVKQGSTDRFNTTLADDPDLASFALGIGTWDVRCMLLMSTIAASTNIKTRWSFTGTWNSPTRACTGPAITNVAAPTAITPTKMTGHSVGGDATYGLAATTAYNVIYEECSTVVVTVAGSLGIQWAQNTVNAAAARMQPGSYVQFMKIAD